MTGPSRAVFRQPDGTRWEGVNFKQIGVPTSPPTFRYVGWRCLHTSEGGYMSDPRGMPEVRPGWQSDDLRAEPPPVRFNEAMQLLSWQLNDFNWPAFTKSNWRAVYSYQRAFTNQNGYNEPGDPRADFVTPKDVREPLPRLMKGIICGGMFIRGDIGFDPSWPVIFDAIQGYTWRLIKNYRRNIRTYFADIRAASTTGNLLRCTPGVHAINEAGPIPTKEDTFANNFYFEATTNYYGKMSHFPQGHGQPVWVPYILRETTAYPLWWFESWISNDLPDPLKIYREETS